MQKPKIFTKYIYILINITAEVSLNLKHYRLISLTKYLLSISSKILLTSLSLIRKKKKIKHFLTLLKYSFVDKYLIIYYSIVIGSL